MLSALANAVASSTGADDAVNAVLNSFKQASPNVRRAIIFLTPWAMLYTAVLRFTWAAYSFSYLWSLFLDRFVEKVTIPSNHPLNAQILDWLMNNRLGKDSKSLVLTTSQVGGEFGQSLSDPPFRPKSRGRHRRIRYGLPPPLPIGGDNHDEDQDKQKADPLRYVPEVGSYWFRFGWTLMTFRSRLGQHFDDRTGYLTRNQDTTGDETITISAISPFRGTERVRRFLEHVQGEAIKEATESAVTKIIRTSSMNGPFNTQWGNAITRPSRKLQSVAMDESIKGPLVEDVKTYLKGSTHKWYAERGIPYRRGYLFYGPPGTGKTSFCTALAGEFGLRIYIVNLASPDIKDEVLNELLAQLPTRCIVLLEDIDSAGLKRETGPIQLPPVLAPPPSPPPKDGAIISFDPFEKITLPSRLTLSGVLNAIDGVAAPEGRLLIMTSNVADSLDPALVRPGRIDRKVYFGNASREVCRQFFERIFYTTPEDIVRGTVDQAEERIAKLAREFADKIPDQQLTPAEVQSFLLIHRSDPAKAVNMVDEWMAEILEEKKKGQDVTKESGEEAGRKSDEADEDGESEKTRQ